MATGSDHSCADRLAGLTVSAESLGGPLATARAGFRGRLPPRYGRDAWSRRFDAEVADSLLAGIEVLELGAGARPALAPEQRPAGCTYVGLDISAAELAKAPPGSYDDQVVADLTQFQPQLAQRFDLVLSWMVLEHVESLPAAVAHARDYLRPGGRLIAQMPGAFSLAALANRLLPAGLTRRLLSRIQERDAATVFPAHYDRCWFTALAGLLSSGWADWRVVPLYTGVFYTAFSAPLRAGYLAYEECAYRREWRNLAPYYLITATAPDPAGRATHTRASSQQSPDRA